MCKPVQFVYERKYYSSLLTVIDKFLNSGKYLASVSAKIIHKWQKYVATTSQPTVITYCHILNLNPQNCTAMLKQNIYSKWFCQKVETILPTSKLLDEGKNKEWNQKLIYFIIWQCTGNQHYIAGMQLPHVACLWDIQSQTSTSVLYFKRPIYMSY